jgi:hypothetical protein
MGFNWGSFRENERWLLSRDSIKLVSALIYARMAGKYSLLEWARIR